MASFLFGRLLEVVFPRFYREVLAASFYRAWRWVLNEPFSLRITLSLRFEGNLAPTAQAVTAAVGASPGGDPRPRAVGDNYLLLQYRDVDDSVAVKWRLDQDDGLVEGGRVESGQGDHGDADGADDAAHQETVFAVGLEPAVRTRGVRGAAEVLAALSNRLDTLRQQLCDLAGHPPQKSLAIAECWLRHPRTGSTGPPELETIPRAQRDPETGGNVRLAPGWVELTGPGPSVLPAVLRYVMSLEPPPARS